MCNLCIPNYGLDRMLRHFDKKHKNPEKYKIKKPKDKETSGRKKVYYLSETRACHYCGKIFPRGERSKAFDAHLTDHRVRNF